MILEVNPMEEGILSAIGGTPLIRLKRVLDDTPVRLYAKMESLNPGGSTKDRPAIKIIRRALETGELKPGSVVVESSSGNMGIGLAQVCAYYKLRFICVVDPKTTQQNIRLLKAYGAEVDVVEQPDPTTGEFLKARIDRVLHLQNTIPSSFCPNQYSNLLNPVAHHDTMREIVAALGQEADYLFCATSTCGTLRGCAEYIREHKMRTKIFAVDAVGSIIFGGNRAKRLIPGHGAAVVPHIFQPSLADECVHVTDLDCVVGCRRLARREAVLCGGSSGGVLMAVERSRQRLLPGATCVAIFPDRGERYLDTIYSDRWVEEHFGDVSQLWATKEEEARQCVTAAY
jgi:cysteine synthase A